MLQSQECEGARERDALTRPGSCVLRRGGAGRWTVTNASAAAAAAKAVRIEPEPAMFT